jgi:ethanolamine ammonia-lyase small subunit
MNDDVSFSDLNKKTPARIGIGHAGARYTTDRYLAFLASQAAASNAVFSEVTKETVEELHVFEVSTKCRSKFEMLTRPDLGREFDDETKAFIADRCVHDPQVQIYFGDGLSSPCIQGNVSDMYPMLREGLEYEGISVGTPFFVRYCRVNTARIIAPLLGAAVTCVLIGERPGLITDESMSAYTAYSARPDMSESDYTVVSNISRVGMAPVEAAAHIVDIIKKMLRCKCSGVALSKMIENQQPEGGRI